MTRPARPTSPRWQSTERVQQNVVVDSIPAVLIRKPIKNLYLRVKPPDQHLEISAPLRMSLTTIEGFVHSRHDWIERMRSRELTQETVDPAHRLSDPVSWTPQQRRDAEWRLRANLDTLLPQWTAVVGRAPTAISLRAMKTRWGSCTPRTGRIRLNLELDELPTRFLEYVLVHELTHLRASGHGTDFQRLMTAYLPQWKELRRELNRYVLS